MCRGVRLTIVIVTTLVALTVVSGASARTATTAPFKVKPGC